jgi:hypothetical protein
MHALLDRIDGEAERRRTGMGREEEWDSADLRPRNEFRGIAHANRQQFLWITVLAPQAPAILMTRKL